MGLLHTPSLCGLCPQALERNLSEAQSLLGHQQDMWKLMQADSKEWGDKLVGRGRRLLCLGGRQGIED